MNGLPVIRLSREMRMPPIGNNASDRPPTSPSKSSGPYITLLCYMIFLLCLNSTYKAKGLNPDILYSSFFRSEIV